MLAVLVQGPLLCRTSRFFPSSGWNHRQYSCTYQRRDGQAEWAWINMGMVDAARVTNPWCSKFVLFTIQPFSQCYYYFHY